jgi:hypothetical protein
MQAVVVDILYYRWVLVLVTLIFMLEEEVLCHVMSCLDYKHIIYQGTLSRTALSKPY